MAPSPYKITHTILVARAERKNYSRSQNLRLQQRLRRELLIYKPILILHLGLLIIDIYCRVLCSTKETSGFFVQAVGR